MNLNIKEVYTMSLITGLGSDSIVTFGNRSDVCVLAAKELAIKEKIDITSARNRLRGQLEGKRIVKFRQSGADIVISLDYIHKIAKEYPLTEKEEVEANDETKESE